MENIPWGLYMTAAGMGTVFLLLLLLMLVLLLIGRLDATGKRPSTPAVSGELGESETGVDDLVREGPAEPTHPSGLSPELIAAITIAVITHAKVRRGQAAPVMRRVEPGSQLFASRWVSVGRAYQNQPWK